MGHLLVQITTGPEQPTKIALGLLIAKTALDEGHEVDLFLLGDGVQVLRPETLEVVHGVGLGSAKEHLLAVAAGGARLFASRMSSNARGISGDGFAGAHFELVAPARFVALTFEADRVVSF